MSRARAYPSISTERARAPSRAMTAPGHCCRYGSAQTRRIRRSRQACSAADAAPDRTMNPVTIALTVLVCVFGGAVIGMLVRTRLSENHLTEGSKDVVKLVTGLIATLSALVLGLLIASAKGSFDAANE